MSFTQEANTSLNVRCYACKRDEFVAPVEKKIIENQGKSMCSLDKEMGMHHKIISKVVREDLRLKSYSLRTSHPLMTTS